MRYVIGSLRDNQRTRSLNRTIEGSYFLLLYRVESVKNTDFLTELGKWISAVPEPFRMKFARNVEKLFP